MRRERIIENLPSLWVFKYTPLQHPSDSNYTFIAQEMLVGRSKRWGMAIYGSGARVRLKGVPRYSWHNPFERPILPCNARWWAFKKWWRRCIKRK